MARPMVLGDNGIVLQKGAVQIAIGFQNSQGQFILDIEIVEIFS